MAHTFKPFSKRSLFGIVIGAGLLLPGLGQYLLGAKQKGTLFFITLSSLFFWGWWLVHFEPLWTPLPQSQLPCFPGFFFWGISFLITHKPPPIEEWNPLYHELGQYCLVCVTFLNMMVFFECLERIYWLSLKKSAFEEPVPRETRTRFWIKKSLMLLTIFIWGSTFWLAQENLKIVCCFPLCFVISLVPKACRYERLSRIFWETERMYLKLVYSVIFIYLILIWL